METVTISKAEYDALKQDYEQLQRQNNWLLEQIRLARHRHFGSSSEKSVYDTQQLNLFNEAEVLAEPAVAEPAVVAVEKHYRKRITAVADKLPADLPVEVVEHALPEQEQICPVCEETLHVMGKEVVRRELKLIPAKAVIVEHIRYTYACRNCERNDIQVPILKAPLPVPVIRGSMASAEAIAHILQQKFVLCVPLYRQEQEWQRQGIELSRQTMSNWLLRVSEDWLQPLYGELRRRLLRRQVLHADETILQVLREPGKAARDKSYMWLYRTGSDTEHPIILYEYQPDRKARRVEDFLAGFAGYLHTDGYSGYHSLPEGIKVVGCWAHARRKFDEALKAQPKGKQGKSSAHIGKEYCDRLFAIESQLAGCSAQERYKKRQELAKPVLEEFLVWLQSIHAGKNAFGQAVRYTLDQWPYLERYLLDGRLEISNNRAERSIKPFVMGRKNFLFANVPRGAKASAICYSIIQTALENGLNPYNYLLHIFKTAPNLELPAHPERVVVLLPENAPGNCKTTAEDL